MLIKSTFRATLLAASAFITVTAYAAETSTAAAVQAEKPAATKVQPHSHLQEKTGMMPQKKPAKAQPDEKAAVTGTAEDTPASANKAKSVKKRADKDKSKHFHPRDGK